MQTILIVEDQKDVQNLLGLVLQKPNRRILHALRGEDGLQLALSERPDLILLDIMIPGGMDGLDLLQLLRQDAAGKSVKVVVMSARTQQKDVAAAYAAGADDFLAKPFRLTELKAQIARHLPEFSPDSA